MASDANISFEGEWPNENVIFLRRAHPFTNASWVIGALISLLAPFLIWFFFSLLPVTLIHISPLTGLVLFLTWFLIVLGISFQRFLFWYFNFDLLTNERIVDFDFISIFSHKISQAALGRIQDVTVEKSGVAQNFFDYGHITVQTAGEVPNFTFESVTDPEGCAKQILELVTKNKDNSGGLDYGKPNQSQSV